MIVHRTPAPDNAPKAKRRRLAAVTETCAPPDGPCAADRTELTERLRALPAAWTHPLGELFRLVGVPQRLDGATCATVDLAAGFVELLEPLAANAPAPDPERDGEAS
jgi:hypothetical protein